MLVLTLQWVCFADVLFVLLFQAYQAIRIKNIPSSGIENRVFADALPVPSGLGQLFRRSQVILHPMCTNNFDSAARDMIPSLHQQPDDIKRPSHPIFTPPPPPHTRTRKLYLLCS